MVRWVPGPGATERRTARRAAPATGPAAGAPAAGLRHATSTPAAQAAGTRQAPPGTRLHRLRVCVRASVFVRVCARKRESQRECGGVCAIGCAPTLGVEAVEPSPGGREGSAACRHDARADAADAGSSGAGSWWGGRPGPAAACSTSMSSRGVRAPPGSARAPLAPGSARAPLAPGSARAPLALAPGSDGAVAPRSDDEAALPLPLAPRSDDESLSPRSDAGSLVLAPAPPRPGGESLAHPGGELALVPLAPRSDGEPLVPSPAPRSEGCSLLSAASLSAPAPRCNDSALLPGAWSPLLGEAASKAASSGCSAADDESLVLHPVSSPPLSPPPSPPHEGRPSLLLAAATEAARVSASAGCSAASTADVSATPGACPSQRGCGHKEVSRWSLGGEAGGQ
jgi:hypothetical protein